MNNEPRNHHYNPQFFLRSWSLSENKIWRTSVLEGGKIVTIKSAIKKTASLRDLYSIRDKYRDDPIIIFMISYLCLKYNKDNIKDLNFERSIFSKIDDEGAVALKKIIESEAGNLDALDEKELKYLIKYLYLLQARNPKTMKHTESAMRYAMREGSKVHSSLVYSFGEDVFANSLKNLLEDNNLSKLALLENCLDPSLIDLYHGIEYIIISTNNYNNSFITSNYPYASFPDIGDKKSLHVFPYSPQACLVMTHNKMLISFLRLLMNTEKEKNVVDLINFIIAASSTEIYSRDKKLESGLENCINLLECNTEKARHHFESFLSKVIEGEERKYSTEARTGELSPETSTSKQDKDKKRFRLWKWFSKH